MKKQARKYREEEEESSILPYLMGGLGLAGLGGLGYHYYGDQVGDYLADLWKRMKGYWHGEQDAVAKQDVAKQDVKRRAMGEAKEEHFPMMTGPKTTKQDVEDAIRALKKKQYGYHGKGNVMDHTSPVPISDSTRMTNKNQLISHLGAVLGGQFLHPSGFKGRKSDILFQSHRNLPVIDMN